MDIFEHIGVAFVVVIVIFAIWFLVTKANGNKMTESDWGKLAIIIIATVILVSLIMILR